MKKAKLFLLVIICSASIFAQPSLHLQAGYFAPQVSLKNEIINGPLISAGVIFNNVYESSFFVETNLDDFSTSNGKTRVDLFTWSWSVSVPFIDGKAFRLSPSIGANMSRFSSQSPLAGRGSMAANPTLTAGMQFGISAIYYNMTFETKYLVREINGLDDQFRVGGLTMSLGYIFEL